MQGCKLEKYYIWRENSNETFMVIFTHCDVREWVFDVPGDDHNVNNERISHKSSQTNKSIEEGQDDHHRSGYLVQSATCTSIFFSTIDFGTNRHNIWNVWKKKRGFKDRSSKFKATTAAIIVCRICWSLGFHCTHSGKTLGNEWKCIKFTWRFFLLWFFHPASSFSVWCRAN